MIIDKSLSEAIVMLSFAKIIRRFVSVTVRCSFPEDIESIRSGKVCSIAAYPGHLIKEGRPIMAIETVKAVLYENAIFDGHIDAIYVKKEQEIYNDTPLYKITNNK